MCRGHKVGQLRGKKTCRIRRLARSIAVLHRKKKRGGGLGKEMQPKVGKGGRIKKRKDKEGYLQIPGLRVQKGTTVECYNKANYPKPSNKSKRDQTRSESDYSQPS